MDYIGTILNDDTVKLILYLQRQLEENVGQSNWKGSTVYTFSIHNQSIHIANINWSQVEITLNSYTKLRWHISIGISYPPDRIIVEPTLFYITITPITPTIFLI